MPQPVHVTFIHGLANKPAPNELARIWLSALAAPVNGDPGFDLGAVGVSSSFVYWADLFYDHPIPADEYEAAPNRAEKLKATIAQRIEAQAGWEEELLLKLTDGKGAPEDAPIDDTTDGYERIPIPWFIKERLMEHFVKEAHDYLFNTNGIREIIRQRVLDDFAKVPSETRHVLVGHSQGTFIGYDVLTSIPECKKIAGFMTLGSPLGMDEVQDKLTWSRDNGFPTKLIGDWVNVYDPFDVVARLDPVLANDFRKDGVETVIDTKEENWGTWRHSATKYFKGPLLRKHLRILCGREGV